MESNPLASTNAAGGVSDRVAPADEMFPTLTMGSRATIPGDSPMSAEVGMLSTPGLKPAGAAENGHAPANGRHTSVHSNGHGGWTGLTLQSVGGALYTPAVLAAHKKSSTLYLRAGKRALDILGAIVGLMLGAPILALAAFLVKLESHGPVLYKSRRVGRGGRPFTFFKLRSMVNGADLDRHRLSHLNESDGPVFKIARDPRVTRIGRFLRTTSIDEIPQLFNVLRGDMSLVGPRPPIAEEVAQYEPWQFRRLEVRPGLTCLWQISGRSRIGFQEWMRLDLEYIRKQSFRLDVKILIRTIPAVLSREGAY